MAEAPKKPEYLKHVYICLLAGGTGTRLWPRSRKATPKQFTALFKTHTLFQQTIRRVKGFVPLSRVFVITNQGYIDDVRRQEPLIPDENIIGEPEKKNTAMAIGVASALANVRDPKAVIVNLASDHQINQLDLYQATLKAAAQTAFNRQAIVTIGIKPTFPHTGMGHIQAGEQIGQIDDLPIYQVKSFKEKPDLETAKKFTASGEYYWNSNKYVFPAKLMLDELKTHAPEVFKAVDLFANSIGTADEKESFIRAYHQVPEISIDYAVAEKSSNMVLIPGRFDWSDIGDWKVIYDLSAKDENGNVIISHGRNGGCVQIDTQDSLIHYEDQLIATIGVEDLIIVDTKDALLVCRKDRAEDVKKMVDLLKEKGLLKYL